MPSTENLTQFPYNMSRILEPTETGNFGEFFIRINNNLSYLPFRATILVISLVVYQMAVFFRPGANKLKIASATSLISAMAVGILSLGGFVPGTDAVLYLIISGLTWFFGGKD